jgi:hypothetical protein
MITIHGAAFLACRNNSLYNTIVMRGREREERGERGEEREEREERERGEAAS